MDCCQCQGIELQFTRGRAAKQLAQYRQKGAAGTTRTLVDALVTFGLEGSTLLDIGGGVGAVQYELLQAGASRATSVEASSAYLSVAQEEADRQGLGDRITFRQGDFVVLAPDLPDADIVTLDRVICCYHDMLALVGLSAAKSRRLYGVVYPRDSWWVKGVLWLLNRWYVLRRNPFRVFAHDTASVDAAIRSNGLHPRFARETLVWQVVVYTRESPA